MARKKSIKDLENQYHKLNSATWNSTASFEERKKRSARLQSILEKYASNIRKTKSWKDRYSKDAANFDYSPHIIGGSRGTEEPWDGADSIKYPQTVYMGVVNG